MYFSQIVEPLLLTFPELRRRNRKTQYLPAKAFSASDRHKDDSEAYVFTDRYFRKLGYCPSAARKLLVDMGLFTFDSSYTYRLPEDKQNGRKGVAKKAYPTEMFHQFNDWLDDVTFELWDAKQNKPATASSDIIPVDGVSIEGNPQVHLDNLKHFIQRGYLHAEKKDGKRRDKKLWRSRARTMWRFATAPNAMPGHLPQSFLLNENTHRIQATSACVQNVHELLRNAMFEGFTDVDIANCHFSTLSQLAPAPTLRMYAEEPSMVREKIAAEIGSNPKSVKRSLIAILYGTDKTFSPYTAMGKNFNNKEQAEAFWHHEITTRIRGESKYAMGQLGVSTHRDLSNRLMREEQRIVRAMARDLTITHPMHDGFIVSGDVDTETMQKRVEQETGYSIKITKKEISYGVRNTKAKR